VRVVVDARLVTGESGGIEGVVSGLAHGLSSLDGSDDYVFAAWSGETAWLEPHVGGQARIVTQPRPPARAASARRASPAGSFGLARRVGLRLRRAMSAARARGDGPPRATDAPSTGGSRPAPDPWVDSLGPDVVHLPIQRGFLSSAPSIYHPHDLQHVHLPEFFSEGQRAWRDRWYGELCRRAAMVAVSSDWTRLDVETHFDLPPGRVRVVPLAPLLSATPTPPPPERVRVLAALGLPPRYALYAAQTWPHKNHVRLLEALALLRSRDGLVVPLVATGRQTEHFEAIAAAARRLGVEGQVTWTGFLPAADLQAILAEASAVVIPTLFEAASGPLWEAFAAGVPAACSNVTALPEQAGDAAVIFDPLDVPGMAAAIQAVWTDDALRSRLVAIGRARVGELSWERTARIFRAHYRRLAGLALGEEDRALVSG